MTARKDTRRWGVMLSRWVPINTRRHCMVLDDHGKRCRNNATRVGSYHGNGEIYPGNVAWVRAELCNVHAAGCP